MQEVWEIFRHWKVTETGHFFAGIGDDRLVDTRSAIFHIFLKDQIKVTIMHLKAPLVS